MLRKLGSEGIIMAEMTEEDLQLLKEHTVDFISFSSLAGWLQVTLVIELTEVTSLILSESLFRLSEWVVIDPLGLRIAAWHHQVRYQSP